MSIEPSTKHIVPASPEQLQFNPDRLQRAFNLLDQAVEASHTPGAVALVGRGDSYVEPYAVGNASLIPKAVPLTESTLFDMASVTKVVTTTTAVLQLIEHGIWRLDDPVRRFWPRFTEGVTLRHLLTHTSGLPAWKPVYEAGEGADAYRQFLENVPLDYETGTRVVYSCLGFLTLAGLIEHVTGQPFADYCDQNILGVLGMEDSTYNVPAERRAQCAATELKSQSDMPLQGVVHDENARGYGGAAGNAGLFSTARDMAIFCRAILNGGTYAGKRILSQATVQLAIQDHTPHLNDSRGLGWVVKGKRTYSSAGDLFAPESFGHTGFTGTSIWMDPTRELYVVLLTNRVHPTRDNTHHIRLRALFHNAVIAAEEK